MDSFDRDVWCLLGLPFDALTMSQAIEQVRATAASRARCFVSTPNLNFVVEAEADESFRDSVINSDLSLADGMPLVWLARVLGVPIPERVAGSDLFETMRSQDTTDAMPGSAAQAFTVFFFGGPERAAERACERLNADGGGLRCVGWHYPGFVGLDEMSRQDIIAKINASGADFLVVSLGARKGQAWIVHNLPRLRVPVVSHLGAVVNFLAGSVSRAPPWMRKVGLEWLWRILEEPALVRRYAGDGLALLRLILTRVLPYMLWRWSRRLFTKPAVHAHVSVPLPAADRLGADSHSTHAADEGCRIVVSGALLAEDLGPLRRAFRKAAASGLDVTVDLDGVVGVDGAFLGLLMMLRKEVNAGRRRLRIERASGRIRRIFWLNAAAYLLK